jgi:hypothetical protein
MIADRAPCGDCPVCWQKKPLDVHHFRYRKLYDTTPKDVQVMCRDCHSRMHKMWELEPKLRLLPHWEQIRELKRRTRIPTVAYIFLREPDPKALFDLSLKTALMIGDVLDQDRNPAWLGNIRRESNIIGLHFDWAKKKDRLIDLEIRIKTAIKFAKRKFVESNLLDRWRTMI